MRIEVPPIRAGQTEKPKVETYLGNDSNNIIMSLILPHELTGELDNKKGLGFYEKLILN